MKKRLLALALVGAMALSMLACGGKGKEAKTDTPTAKQDESCTTLTVYAWDKNFNIPALRAAEKDFQAVVPGFKLNIEEKANSTEVEQAVTLAGSNKDYSTLPDIVLFQDHYIQRYLTDYPGIFLEADDTVNWSGLGAEKLSYSTFGGKHFGYPVDAGTAIFAYRTDLLQQCGYTIKDVTGITWDRFIQIGKEVYAKTGKYLLCMDGSGNDLFYMMLQEEGTALFKNGEPYITKNEACVKIFTNIVEMCKSNVLALGNDWSGYTNELIQGDKVAGVFNGNWIIPTIKQVEANSGKWAITTAPTLTGAEGYASNGGSSLYITTNTKNYALAKQFLAYTFGGGSAKDGTSITYDEALTNGGVIGTCAAAAGSKVYQNPDPYFNNQAIYSTIVGYTQKVPTVEQNDYHYSARTVLGTALQEVLEKGTSIEEALKTAENNLRFEMGL